METQIINNQKSERFSKNQIVDNDFNKKIKFGIIGCSRIAKKSMLPAINNSEFAEISMIGSRSKEKALEFCKEFRCDSYGTYEDVLKNKDIEAVYISLPIGLHEEWTIKAAKAKKHILCEKSSTISLESAKKMVATCKRNNVRLLENFMFKYHPQHKEVIKLIKDDVLGDLFMFEGHFGFPFPDKENIRLKKELGGGILNDAACYPIYASRMLFGENPVSVVCNLKIDSKFNVDTKADIFLTYPSGKIAFISAIIGAYFQSTYRLWGSESFLSMKRAYAIPKDMETRIFLDRADKINEIKIEPADHFKLALEDFCKEISNKKNPKKNFESDLLAQARVLEAARLSNKEKRIVHLSEF